MRYLKKIVIGLVGFVVLTGAAGHVWESSERAAVRRDIPVAGRMVDIGGRKIQIDCRGTGSPTVVLESGLDMLGSYAWASVHDSLAQNTRVCAYSRAGIMWSEPAKRPFSATTVATDLKIALERSGERGPMVMVGHSIGALYVTKYTQMYGSDVAGIVLVDGSHADQFARYKEATGMSLLPPAEVFEFGATMSRTGLLRIIPTDGAPPSAPEVAHRIPDAFVPVSIGVYAEEMKHLLVTTAPDTSFHGFGSRPLYVLTSAAAMPEDQRKMMRMTDAQEAKRLAAWLAMQDDWAKQSTNSKHEVFADASHYIQFDRPDAVIRAVRSVVASVRAGDASMAKRGER